MIQFVLLLEIQGAQIHICTRKTLLIKISICICELCPLCDDLNAVIAIETSCQLIANIIPPINKQQKILTATQFSKATKHFWVLLGVCSSVISSSMWPSNFSCSILECLGMR